MNNSEKLIVVTGGTRGVGRHIIEKFISNGFVIATCSRNAKDLSELRIEIKEKHDVLIHTYAADLSKKEKIRDFIEFVRMIGKPVDILVNNAGVFIPGSVIKEQEGTLELMMNTNLYSAYYISRGLLPAMIKNKSGHIFNICSVASLQAYPTGGSYSISKFAMYGFSKALREELKNDDVRVTAILAGAIKTSSWDEVDLPSERFMKPEDIADIIYSTYNLSKQTDIEEIILRPQLGDI